MQKEDASAEQCLFLCCLARKGEGWLTGPTVFLHQRNVMGPHSNNCPPRLFPLRDCPLWLQGGRGWAWQKALPPWGPPSSIGRELCRELKGMAFFLYTLPLSNVWRKITPCPEVPYKWKLPDAQQNFIPVLSLLAVAGEASVLGDCLGHQYGCTNPVQSFITSCFHDKLTK